MLSLNINFLYSCTIKLCDSNECISVITISSLNELLRRKYTLVIEMFIVRLYKFFDLPLS
jgi:hypothetical protein